VQARSRDARLIIAPHEPTPQHVEPIERWATDTGLRSARLGDAVADTDVIIVDRVGVLGDLYALASMAYVGGAFHAAGLHSVLEPAAFGVPVLFGPRYADSRDAVLLRDDDAAISVPDADALVKALEHWFTSPGERKAAGDAAARVVHRGLGAAERSYALVKELLS
jgi:3-deoxy-D-manno-octulosonic-acid transferase